MPHFCTNQVHEVAGVAQWRKRSHPIGMYLLTSMLSPCADINVGIIGCDCVIVMLIVITQQCYKLHVSDYDELMD